MESDDISPYPPGTLVLLTEAGLAKVSYASGLVPGVICRSRELYTINVYCVYVMVSNGSKYSLFTDEFRILQLPTQ